jgi:hypothetical protein
VVIFYSNVVRKGTVMHGQILHVLGVLESPGDQNPIGTAFSAGRTADGRALWRLVVHGTELTGRFTLTDGEFMLAK